MSTVEERLERIERILEGSGLALLAELRLAEVVEDQLATLADPKNLRLLSILDRFLEQADALEKLAETLERLDRSGALNLIGAVPETLVENLPQLAEAGNLRLLSHVGKAAEVLSRIDPNAAGTMVDLFLEALSETLPPEKLKHPPRAGLLGVLRALADPEIQRALGILLELLRALARTLEKARRTEEELAALMERMRVQGGR